MKLGNAQLDASKTASNVCSFPWQSDSLGPLTPHISNSCLSIPCLQVAAELPLRQTSLLSLHHCQFHCHQAPLPFPSRYGLKANGDGCSTTARDLTHPLQPWMNVFSSVNLMMAKGGGRPPSEPALGPTQAPSHCPRSALLFGQHFPRDQQEAACEFYLHFFHPFPLFTPHPSRAFTQSGRASCRQRL